MHSWCLSGCQKAVPGIWKIEVKPVMQTKGEFHMWLPMKEFLDGEVYFLESNPDTTFTEPAGGEHTMTVSYYNSQENTVDINSMAEGILEMKESNRIMLHRE